MPLKLLIFSKKRWIKELFSLKMTKFCDNMLPIIIICWYTSIWQFSTYCRRGASCTLRGWRVAVSSIVTSSEYRSQRPLGVPIADGTPDASCTVRRDLLVASTETERPLEVPTLYYLQGPQMTSFCNNFRECGRYYKTAARFSYSTEILSFL